MKFEFTEGNYSDAFRFGGSLKITAQGAQHYENDNACEEGREPEQFDGEPAAEYGPKYRAAIDAICAQAEPILAELNLNRYPRGKGGNLAHHKDGGLFFL